MFCCDLILERRGIIRILCEELKHVDSEWKKAETRGWVELGFWSTQVETDSEGCRLQEGKFWEHPMAALEHVHVDIYICSRTHTGHNTKPSHRKSTSNNWSNNKIEDKNDKNWSSYLSALKNIYLCFLFCFFPVGPNLSLV